MEEAQALRRQAAAAHAAAAGRIEAEMNEGRQLAEVGRRRGFGEGGSEEDTLGLVGSAGWAARRCSGQEPCGRRIGAVSCQSW